MTSIEGMADVSQEGSYHEENQLATSTNDDEIDELVDVEDIPTEDTKDEEEQTLKNGGSVNGHVEYHQWEDSTGGNSSANGEEICCVCAKKVYPMERFSADKRLYHKTCFRCSKCKRLLGVDFAVNKGLLYCNPHFMELFKMRGRYDDIGDAEIMSSTDRECQEVVSEEENTLLGPRHSTKDLLAKFKELEAPKGGEGDSTENQHNTSILSDELPPQDTTRNLTAKWQAMQTSNGATRTPDTNVTSQKKLRENSAIASKIQSDNENAPSYLEKLSGERAVSENTPRVLPEGVVRSEIGEIRVGEMPQAGTTRNLLARFQQVQ